MLKGRILKPALAAVITITSAIALSSLGATAASASTCPPNGSGTDHYICNTATLTGFGIPPASGDPYEPVSLSNLDYGWAAVSEGGGYYEWQTHNDAGVLECITADVNSGYVTAEPCGDYPASQEWNYSDYGGTGTLYNPYASEYFNEPICIAPTTPYMKLVECTLEAKPYYTNDWVTPYSSYS
jgi:hypothetical protein